jgi:hypothetical protein
MSCPCSETGCYSQWRTRVSSCTFVCFIPCLLNASVQYLRFCDVENCTWFVRSESLTAAAVRIYIFRDVTPCSPLKVSQHFGGTCRLHLLGWIMCIVKADRKQSKLLLVTWVVSNLLRLVIKQKSMQIYSRNLITPEGREIWLILR